MLGPKLSGLNMGPVLLWKLSYELNFIVVNSWLEMVKIVHCIIENIRFISPPQKRWPSKSLFVYSMSNNYTIVRNSKGSLYETIHQRMVERNVTVSWENFESSQICN